jgi:hypothetical protein
MLAIGVKAILITGLVTLANVLRDMLSASGRRRIMPYNIARIDVHQRMLHVVVSDVEIDGEYEFARQIFGSSPEALARIPKILGELAQLY